MVEEFLNKIDEWNKPNWEQIDSDYLQMLEENTEYYKTFVKMLESELDFFDESKDDALEVIANIKEYLNELNGVIR